MNISGFFQFIVHMTNAAVTFLYMSPGTEVQDFSRIYSGITSQIHSGITSQRMCTYSI